MESRIKEAAAAIEEESLLGLAGCISRDYADPEGRSYETILGVAKGFVFDRFEDIEISFLSCRVTVTGAMASAAISVQARGTPSGGGKRDTLEALFGDREVRDFVIGLKKSTDGWRIVRIEESEAP